MADKFKTLGNDALKAGQLEDAVKFYTEAIKLEPANHTLYSNRAAAYGSLKRYSESLADADKTVQLKPDWVKGYSRKGAALHGLARLDEAEDVYEAGLKLEPTNQALLDGKRDVEREQRSAAGRNMMNPFAQPGVEAKLMANPKSAKLFSQPDFQAILSKLQRDPNSLKDHLADPRVMTALSALLGVDLESADLEEPPQRPEPPKKEEMETDMTLSEGDRAAQAEKELGNAAYRERDFPTALRHYEAAMKLSPTDAAFLLNRAAVYLEQGEFTTCISECERAIELGRENRADFKLLARGFARIGNCYAKMKNLPEAVKFLNKSLSEHRDPAVVKRVAQLEKEVREATATAYINPELSEQEKLKGNELFSKGKFPDAIQCYSEAIKRNPSDGKLFSNRSGCYMKLMEFGLALRDAEECTSLEPQFVKGWLRKAAAQLAMKEFTKAQETYRHILTLDPDCTEAKEGYRRSLKTSEDPDEIRQRAMKDPEIQAILADPGMQLILQQMQQDPRAAQDHLKNPEVAKKIQVLMSAGILSVR